MSNSHSKKNCKKTILLVEDEAIIAMTEAAVPIIALTPHTYAEDIDKCREAGMNYFISKPANEAQMRKTIAAWTG